MVQEPYRFVTFTFRTTVALAALLLASCVAPPSQPEQVQASNPSVTYKYHNDQELLQVNQSAATFCNQYRGTPQATNFATDPDGSNDVVFQCVPTTTSPVSQVQVNPNLTYTYGTDAQLLDASRNAQTYCRNAGSAQVSSSISTNVDGTKTVTFQCNQP